MEDSAWYVTNRAVGGWRHPWCHHYNSLTKQALSSFLFYTERNGVSRRLDNSFKATRKAGTTGAQDGTQALTILKILSGSKKLPDRLKTTIPCKSIKGKGPVNSESYLNHINKNMDIFFTL